MFLLDHLSLKHAEWPMLLTLLLFVLCPPPFLVNFLAAHAGYGHLYISLASPDGSMVRLTR